MSDTERPLLRIIHGDATPEEIAAIVAVLAARAAAPGGEPPPRRSAWSERARTLRRPLPHGPGAWRASAFPG